MSSVPALELGQDLEEFTFVKLLGAGGFGITYQAIDRTLQRDVAIKEYFPQQFAERRSDNTIVSRPGDDNAQTFQWGLDRFLAEARTLAKLDHPNVVKVSRYFERNGTAYLVMAFEEGSDLADWLSARSELPSEAEIKSMMLPLLDGLQAIHEQGLIHRDIKPQNIVVRANGTPVLIDFGSARSVGQEQTTVTTLISPGYSPPEQYSNDPALQGPWTDIYAIAGVMYRMIAGEGPPDAMGRIGGTPLRSAADVAQNKLSPALLKAVDRGLDMEAAKRPQSVAEFRALLLGEKIPVARKADSETTTLLNSGPLPGNKKTSNSKWVVGAAVLSAVIVFGAFLAVRGGMDDSNSAGAAVAETEPAESAPSTPTQQAPVDEKAGAADVAGTKTHALMFSVTPADAMIEVDGQPYATGQRFAPGRYAVTASKPGYDTTTEDVVVDGDRVVNLSLAETAYPFTIEPTPPTARIQVADTDAPYTPGMALEPGAYRVAVSAPGYQTFTGTLDHGQAATMRPIELAKLHALTLNVTPADAVVEMSGRTYRPGMLLTAGNYQVTVRKDGFQTQQQTLKLDQDRVVDMQLAPLGVLTLILRPADAQVQLPDAGLTYRPGMQLPIGPLRVVATKQRYQTFDRKVMIQPGNNAIMVTLQR